MLNHLLGIFERKVKCSVVLLRGQVEHGIGQYHFTYSTETTATQLVLNCFLNHVVKGPIFDSEPYSFKFKQTCILFNQCILRLRKDEFQRCFVERVEICDNR